MSLVPDNYGVKLPEGIIPPESPDDAAAFYGWDPARYLIVGEEGASVRWERQLLYLELPQPLHYIGREVRRIRMHPKCAAWALAALKEIHSRGLWHFLDPFGGSYNFRLQRGGARLSAHAYGAGLDFDPDRNKLGANPSMSSFANEPRGMEVVQVFEDWGFYWGGRWARPDSMHFQFGIGW